MSDGPLEQLAAFCGIEREAVDWHGTARRVSADTLRRLLQAMGIDAADDAAAEKALAALEDERWQQSIDGVQVVPCDRPFAIEVRLAAAAELRWRLALETGDERAGAAAIGTLELVASRQAAQGARECRRLELPPVPAGYHTLTIEPGGNRMTVIATPGSCWLPEGPAKHWGIAVQLYLVRSARNWGIGDFTDLRRLVSTVRERGGGIVGLNPLHAMFPDNPEHASPYSPASRLLTNVLNIDVEAVPEFAASAAAQALLARPDLKVRLADCRQTHFVDYREVAALKDTVLEMLFHEAHAAGGQRWREFAEFRRARGEVFERHCLFLALRTHFAAQSAELADWRRWPAAYQDVESAEVAGFANEHAAEVAYVAWLQWLADEQLAAAAADARQMPVGLYADLAVGADPSGAETWSEPKLVAAGVHVGAPPDPMSERGQDWGLPPFDPRQLRAQNYRSFIELIRANMRHAGALRIDHAMALQRLYWIPAGSAPTEGTYVVYPLEDLVGILALESHRHRCMVIGEDLGTVPPGFRERMAEANVLSYRVLAFEREDSGAFIPPERYPELSVAVFGNHDLPTLRGWWDAHDLELQAELEGTSPEDLAPRRTSRARDKQALLDALRSAQLLPQDSGEPSPRELVAAVHAFLGRTCALLALAQLDDVALERKPVNVPSLQQYPNWRRRLTLPLEELAEDPILHGVAAAFAAAGRGPADRA